MSLKRLSHNTATTKHATLAQAAEAAAKAGLGGIAPWRDRVQEVGTAQAATIISDHGLEVTSLCRGGFLTAQEPAAVKAALDDNRLAIEEAAAIGTKELIMVVGGLPASTGPGGPAAQYPAGASSDPGRNMVAIRQQVQDRIGELVPFAAEHGVRLVLEPLHPIFAADRAVISTIDQALDMAEPFDPAHVGVVIDTYHVWWDPYLEAAIKRAGAANRIASYQICDWILPLRDEPLNSRGHVGDGYIDFASITSWVKDAGYTGPIEVEIFNEEIWADDPHETIATMAAGYQRYVAPFL